MTVTPKTLRILIRQPPPIEHDYHQRILYHNMCALRTLWRNFPLIFRSMKPRNVIGDHVKQARRSSKPRVTQNELVARLQVLGVSIDRSMLSKIENGSRPVYDYEVVALAKALKVSVAWLYGEKD